MRRWFIWMLALTLTVVMALPALAATGPVTVEGKAPVFDVEPQEVDGVLMIPIRAVAEGLGGTVAWDPASRTATITTRNRTVLITAGQSKVQVDGTAIAMSHPATLKGGRLLVPASFLLLFYGNQLHVDHPAVRDPKAMELLLRSTQNPLVDYDLVSTSRVDVADGTVAMTIDQSMTGQVRGEESLMRATATSPLMPLATTTEIALRGGQMYLKQGEAAWVKMPAQFRAGGAQGQTQTLLGQVSDEATLRVLVREARLGESRMVDGVTLQDITITYDMDAMMKIILATMPGAAAAGNPAELPLFERYSATVTVNSSTGAMVGHTSDMVISLRVPKGEEVQVVRIAVHQVITFTPTSEPIPWPAGVE